MQSHPRGNLDEKAGLGSRFGALLIDGLLSGLVVGALVVVPLFFMGLGSSGTGTNPAFGLIAILQLFGALFVVGYFFVMEAVFGYTIGKKALGLVVKKDDNSDIGWVDAIIRNLLRLVDALPTLYLVGAVVMFLSDDTQRLGDLAASTVVVKQA